MMKLFGFGYINAWKITINNFDYLVTPAHNLIYKKNNIWKISNLIKGTDINDWKINKDFILNDDILSDLAWKKLKTNNLGLSFYSLQYDDIIKCNFYFYQSYDYLGNLSPNATLGCIDSYIYKSPDINFFESLNIGFKGFSGSCVINSNQFVGLFIRRGVNLGGSMSRGIIIPNFVISSIINKNDFVNIDELS